MARFLLVKLKPRRAQRSAEAEIWRRNTRRLSAFSAVHSWRRCRHGISLLEVLISMGVLAVGLLGIAALIPAGRHEIAEGSRLDNAAMVGRASFRDLQVRGFLNPGNAAGVSNWKDVNSADVWRPQPPNQLAPFTYNNGGSYTNQVRVVIDPLGLQAIRNAGAGPYDVSFPFGAAALAPPVPHLFRIGPAFSGALAPAEVMDSIFRSAIDLISQENTANSDLPPLQFWFRDPTNTDLATNMLRRGSDGNYSWLATIVSEPTESALSSKVIVSVAVFQKRDLSTAGAGEYAVSVTWPSGTNNLNTGVGVGGAELSLFNLPAAKTIRPGEWIMLAGRRRLTGPPPIELDYFRWYRVVSARAKTGTAQNVTLSGTDWDPQLVDVGNNFTRAFVFDNIVAVYEKNLSLEIE